MSRTTRSPSRRSRRLTLARGTVTRNGQTYAEVAYPLGGSVVLLSASLHDQLQVVVRRPAPGLHRRRAGHGLRRAARVRGRERSSRAGSAGWSSPPTGSRPADFDEPVVDHGSDEVGQLARSFERMRLRLAHLDRARGEFIANASHELRTPLFSLGGFLELLDDPDLDERDARRVPRPDARAGRPPDEARDRPARPLAPRRRPADRRRETIDLAELAGDLARRVPRRAPRRSRIRSRWPGRTACSPLGDGERALQIGRILVENALVHTPAGTTVRISVRARRRPRDPDRRERRAGDPPRGPAADLRALLPPGRRPGLGQRPRPGDRAVSWRR